MKQQRTILIIDETPEKSDLPKQTFLRDYIRQLLSQSLFTILEAASVLDGQAICQRTPIDAVLISSRLNLDSRLAQRVNQDWTEAFPTIVVLIEADEAPDQSRDFDAIAMQWIKQGAQDYLFTSQLTPERLEHTIQAAILRHDATRSTLEKLRHRLEQSQADLDRREERLRLALEAAQMRAWDWNLITGELSWSPNDAALVGINSDTAPTTLEAWVKAIHPSDRRQTHEAFMRSRSTRSHLYNEYRIIKPDGEVRWLCCKGRVECNAENQPVRMVGITQDITDSKCLEVKRSQLLRTEIAAREEAEMANQTKDEFLAIVTHELRTPLNAILGWAKLLRSRNLEPDSVDRALETIERNAQTQSQLIEDLLDMSRIIRGQLRLKSMSVNLYAMISAAIEGVRLIADAKQINLEFTAMDLDLTINGDPERLQQILLNLLTNAIKFTPENGSVNVQLTTGGSLASEIANIIVSDTGIGISAEFLPYVFDRFRQDEGNPSEEGLGLGLAIVRQLVELHKGTIHVESEGEGKGATFTVQFPLI